MVGNARPDRGRSEVSDVGWSEVYPVVHRSLAPEYRGLPIAQVERLLGEVFGERVDIDQVESFLGDLGGTLGQVGRAVGGVAKQAVPVVGKALPGALAGAAGGAALGLPGIVGGAILGGVGSAIGGGPTPRQPTAGPGQPQTAGPGVGPSGAVAQLLAALSSPTVQQALAAMMLGKAGNRTVPTATGAQVPVAALTNLLGVLANRASAEWDAVVPYDEGDYLAEAFPGTGLDAANPQARAGWLYEQLALPDAESDDEEWEPDDSWMDDYYDHIEASIYTAAGPDADGTAGSGWWSRERT